MIYIKDEKDIGRLLYRGEAIGFRIRIRGWHVEEPIPYDIGIDIFGKKERKPILEYLLRIGKPIKMIEYKGILVSKAETAQDKFVKEITDSNILEEVINYLTEMMKESFTQ